MKFFDKTFFALVAFQVFLCSVTYLTKGVFDARPIMATLFPAALASICSRGIMEAKSAGGIRAWVAAFAVPAAILVVVTLRIVIVATTKSVGP